MATVTGMTADRMLAIEAASVVDGDVVGDNLILTKHNGITINAGNVRGPIGPTGADGEDGTIPIQELGNFPFGVTMDLFTQPGTYTQTIPGNISHPADGYPINQCGILEVLSSNNEFIVVQRYTVAADAGEYAGQIFTRGRFDDIWSPWRNIADVGVWTNLTLGTSVVAYTAAGSGYQRPQYKVVGKTVKLRGLAKTTEARTATFTVATMPVGTRPAEDEIFLANTSQTFTSSGVSTANTGTASTGTEHTHPMPHTHIISPPASRLDVRDTGEITIPATAASPIPINGHISLSGIFWDID